MSKKSIIISIIAIVIAGLGISFLIIKCSQYTLQPTPAKPEKVEPAKAEKKEIERAPRRPRKAASEGVPGDVDSEEAWAVFEENLDKWLA